MRCNEKTYVLYHLRWQLSAVVMMPFLWLFTDIMGIGNQYAVLSMIQMMGAVIFWEIDKSLFKGMMKE